MNRTLSLLAAAVTACGLFACNSDGTMRNASTNNDWNNSTASNNNADSQLQIPNLNDPNNTIQLNDGNDKTTAHVTLSGVDRGFILDASAGGNFEVMASEKAIAKSTDGKVKTLAQQMIDAHTKANQQLSALAKRKHVEVPSLPSADQIKMLASLDNLNGSDFDREYMSQQKTAHVSAISAFETESVQGSDRDTREFAAQMLPTLRDHLRMFNGDETNTNVGMAQ